MSFENNVSPYCASGDMFTQKSFQHYRYILHGSTARLTSMYKFNDIPIFEHQSVLVQRLFRGTVTLINFFK